MLAFRKFLHFIYLSHSLASILYRVDNASSDQAVECSPVTWDTKALWDEDYESYS